jgi:colanic acid/amylovoran biosynthesis glycosyltransferase
MNGEQPRPDVSVVSPEGGAEDRYAAFNDAAGRATGEWLLFSATETPVALRRPGLARQARGLDALALEDGSVLVSRRWFESVGGFAEGVSAGAELDLLLRLDQVGRRVGGSADAAGPAARWIRRRHPGAGSRLPRSPGLAGLRDNRIPARRSRPARAPSTALVVFTDAFPARSETFVHREVAAFREQGWAVRVESSARPARIERGAARRGRIDYLEDDPPAAGLRDLAALVFRHPIRCLADVLARRRWRREERAWPLRSLASAARRLEAGGERHLHVHFAGLACLHAMRIARITGVTYSVAVHGYDVFATPRNLGEKLAGAAFVAAPSEYTAAEVRALTPRGGDRVHVIVMGVDGEEFRRHRPYPGGRSVVAIGRLVEKKGFADLVEAANLLERSGDPLDRLAIAGDGPLRAELEAAVTRASLDGRVEILDAWGTGAVRDLLEDADLLALPAVIAKDGDRDAMPLVIKEALAMEVPVVGSDEAGLPEIVSRRWGRLVPPGDPAKLAEAIAALLALPPEERRRMGAAGREHVLAHCDVATETAKLAGLIEATLAER